MTIVKNIARRLPRRLNPWWSELTVLEPQQFYDEVIAHYVIPNEKRQYFFSLNAGHARMFVEQAKAKGLDLSDRVIPFKTIDPALDHQLYTTGSELAGHYFRLLRNACNAVTGNPDLLIPKAIVRPCSVALHDRFVAQLRAAWSLLEVSRVREFAHYRVAPRIGHWSDYVIDTLNLDGPREVETLKGYLTPAQISQADKREQLKAPLKFRRLPMFDYDAVEKTNAGRFGLFVSNFRDRQYGATSSAVLEEVGLPMTVMSSSLPSDDPVTEVEVHWKTVPGYAVNTTTIHPQIATILNRTNSRFRELCENHDDPRVAVLAAKLVTYLRTAMPPLLDYIVEFHRRFEPMLDRIDVVTVSPGRYLESGLAVAMAHARDLSIPTIEIQSGTISPTKRFVKPQATNVLAIDPFSASVYSRFMGRKEARCHVVGAPKLDKDLAPWRDASEEMVHAASREITVPDPFLLIASQPCTIEVMSALVQIAFEAALRTGFSIVIKTHPNEDNNYRRAYRQIAERFPKVPYQILTETPLHAAILRSSAVSTYFSTVGMEAFCLKRPVIAINPTPGRPPFDLQALGVAVEASSVEQMVGYLSDLETVARVDDPALAVLQDGQAAERCGKFITGRAKAYRRRLAERTEPEPSGSGRLKAKKVSKGALASGAKTSRRQGAG